jgi:stage V sporulation protein K
LLPCRRLRAVGDGRGTAYLSPRPEEAGYDSDDILEPRSPQDSESDGIGEENECKPCTVLVPPGSRDHDVWEELNKLVGLEPVKQHVRGLVGFTEIPPIPHLLLVGNAGVGKSTVARLYARILRDLGFLHGGQLEEPKVEDLIGRALLQTDSNICESIHRAQGGVLLIDEAHKLSPTESANNLGKVVIDRVKEAIKGSPNTLLVIFATEPSKVETFLGIDPVLNGLLPHVLHLPDYTKRELAQILDRMITKDERHKPDVGLVEKVSRIVKRMSVRGTGDSRNAGLVRQVYEVAERWYNVRGADDGVMKVADFKFLENWA